MTSAAVYLRISQDPTGEQAGVTRQREDCLALVEQQGWKLFDTYQDNDISASSGKVRPHYDRMLKDIAAGHIDAVVAWHPDRLYRKLRDLEGLIESIESRNVIMRTVRAGEIDLSTPTGRMLARILSATAQAEGEVKADRWRRSWRQGREAGKYARTGSRTFGYTRDGEIIPEEAEIARRMARDILAGVPIQAVARWLQAEGIKSTRDGVWRPAALRQYLTNPTITGYATLGVKVPTGKHDKDGRAIKTREVTIVGEGTWEPILDRDTWETICALLNSRTRPRPPRVAVLNGLAFCGNCGHRLITTQSRQRRRYSCPSNARPGMDGCGKVSVDAEYAEQVVESYAQTRLSDPRVTQRAAELRSGGGGRKLLTEIAALEARLVELDTQLDQPGVPVARLVRAIDRTRERLEECHRQLAAATRESTPVIYTGGMEWPEGLAERRQLIEVALGDDRVFVDLVTRPGNRFDPTRVRIDKP